MINPNCSAPTGDSPAAEVAIDPEWASAAAPGATIVVAACQDNGTMMGYQIALENYVDNYQQQIISLSFGECEADLGAGGNSVLNATYEQAAAEGFSVFVAVGDGGAAGCDQWGVQNGYATQGIAVSGFASSPYVVAVGGTTYGDWALGKTSDYWNSTNGQYWVPRFPTFRKSPGISPAGTSCFRTFIRNSCSPTVRLGFATIPNTSTLRIPFSS